MDVAAGPGVTVVVSVYNTDAKELRDCLRSVALQTLRPNQYSVVVVDDRSSDEHVPVVIGEFAASRKNWLSVTHPENRGVNEARRTGVNLAQSEYVVFLDSDDVLTRDALEFLLMECQEGAVDLVTAPQLRWDPETSGHVIIPSSDRGYPPEREERLRTILGGEISFTMCGRLIRRSMLTSDVFDMGRTLHEDLVSTTRLVTKVNTVAHQSRFVYVYRRTNSSITVPFGEEHLDGFRAGINEWRRIVSEQFGKTHSEQRAMNELVDNTIDSILSNSLASAAESNLSDVELLQFIDSVRQFVTAEVVATSDRNWIWRVFDLSDVRSLRGRMRDEAAISFGPRRMSALARRLSGKIVFVCQVDYQVRNAVLFAKELRFRGHECAILDNSQFVDGGRRTTRASDKAELYGTEYFQIVQGPYRWDWLTTASLVLAFNDVNDDFRLALEFRNLLTLPTACVVEGISDFLRTDAKDRMLLPYRRCEFVFLAGDEDGQFFSDRETRVVGLPAVESLLALEPDFPERPLVGVNLNFTYGVLEDRRDDYLRAVRAALASMDVDWEITQHPMDQGDVLALPLASGTQYDLIERSSVFVSRFATGIVEALASGKPVVYFNPHDERVIKFENAYGAYETAKTSRELVTAIDNALADIAAGVDFRVRAADFLRHHAAIDLLERGETAAQRFSDAVMEVISLRENDILLATGSVMERFALDVAEGSRFERCGGQSNTSDFFVEFPAKAHASIVEGKVIDHLFGDQHTGSMISVGAESGTTLQVFLSKGWDVIAFEPDPNSGRALGKCLGVCELPTVRGEVVSNESGLEVSSVTDPASNGISGLSSLDDAQVEVRVADTITLADYLLRDPIEHVSFLQVNVDVFQKIALEGFPFDRDKPDFVVAEFEDAKTIPLGYAGKDIVKLLQSHGYYVYVSEWYPVAKDGMRRRWRGMRQFSPDLDLSRTWGYLMAAREPVEEARMIEAVVLSLRFSNALKPADLQRRTGKKSRASTGHAGRSQKQVESAAEKPRLRVRLSERLPGTTVAVRGVRSGVFPALGSRDLRLASREALGALRDGFPVGYEAGRPLGWIARAAARNRSLAGLAAALLVLSEALARASASSNIRNVGRVVSRGVLMAGSGAAVSAKIGQIEEGAAEQAESKRVEIMSAMNAIRDLETRLVEAEERRIDDDRKTRSDLARALEQTERVHQMVNSNYRDELRELSQTLHESTASASAELRSLQSQIGALSAQIDTLLNQVGG